MNYPCLTAEAFIVFPSVGGGADKSQDLKSGDFSAKQLNLDRFRVKYPRGFLWVCPFTATGK